MEPFTRGAMYSPNKQMFICETQEQRDELEARGWTPLPEDYKPDEAQYITTIPAESNEESTKPAKTTKASKAK